MEGVSPGSSPIALWNGAGICGYVNPPDCSEPILCVSSLAILGWTRILKSND